MIKKLLIINDEGTTNKMFPLLSNKISINSQQLY